MEEYTNDIDFLKRIKETVMNHSPNIADISFTRNHILELCDKGIDALNTNTSGPFNSFYGDFVGTMIFTYGGELGAQLFDELQDIVVDRDYAVAYKEDNIAAKIQKITEHCTNDSFTSPPTYSDPELDYMLSIPPIDITPPPPPSPAKEC